MKKKPRKKCIHRTRPSVYMQLYDKTRFACSRRDVAFAGRRENWDQRWNASRIYTTCAWATEKRDAAVRPMGWQRERNTIIIIIIIGVHGRVSTYQVAATPIRVVVVIIIYYFFFELFFLLLWFFFFFSLLPPRNENNITTEPAAAAAASDEYVTINETTSS